MKICTLGVMGVLSIYFYYIFYPFHGETKTHYWIYLVLLIGIYASYKFIQYHFPVEKRSFTALGIISFFLFHLLILSLFFFAINGQSLGLGLILFFKIIFLLFLILLLWIVIYAFGSTILNLTKVYQDSDEKILHGLASLGIGFLLFIFGLFVLGALGLYSMIAVMGLILIMAGVSYTSLYHIFLRISDPLEEYRFKLDLKSSFSEKYNPAYIIDEMHVIIITFLLSVNFINVFRPFPIGWDDLGVYMNYPKLLSQAGELVTLGQMYTWQLYTGIGFLSGSQTVAFFMNSFSGVIAAGVIYLGLKFLIGDRKTYFNIPLLAVVILLMMPMSIFQLAKDMKLDYGLLSFSVIPIIMLYNYFLSEKKYTLKNSLPIFLIIGLLIGLSFSMKLTSLLLLIACIGAIFYKRLSLYGFIGFIFLFIGIFTYGNLWSYMNVALSGSQSFIFSVSLSLVLGAIGLFLFVVYTRKHILLKLLFLEVGILCLGFVIALLPWGIKHISQVPAGTAMSIGVLLSGQYDGYIPKYENIYSERELTEKRLLQEALMSNDGTTSNEDFGRYFGYEGGINNYLKLPWNLTFQVNQKGEFTDITYIFFALIPALFLFLPYRREYYIYPIIAFIALLLLYYIPSPVSTLITDIFSTISLPLGYVFILAFFLCPLLYLYYTLDRSKQLSQLFLLNFAVSSLYVFLWTVSAFGIVWYGIAMYFLFFVMITLCLISPQVEDSEQEQGAIYRYVALGIVWSYIIISSIPHGLSNIATAGYNNYKMGMQTEESAIFTSHPDYFTILFELNIAPENHESFFQRYKKDLETLLSSEAGSENFIQAISGTADIYELKSIMTQLTQYSINKKLDSDIENLLQKLYSEVIYVDADIKNERNIYRVGTFLKYFISENHKRIFEDSLLTSFQDYIYDEQSLDTTIERFKKLDLSYILLDLNAATIDTDPEQNLTTRYENILKVVTHPEAELIETDSVCLRIGIDDYKINKDMPRYLSIVGINYGSGEQKNLKVNSCLDAMVEVIFSGEISDMNYPYLRGYINALNNLELKEMSILDAKKALAPYIGISYKALFKIN